MRRIVCVFLSICFLCCFSACTSEPTANVMAVQLGDSEKEARKKAGYPDWMWGTNEEVYLYSLAVTMEEDFYKLLWFNEDNRVDMMALMYSQSAENCKQYFFYNWEIDETHQFMRVDEMIEKKVWDERMGLGKLIAALGTDFELRLLGFTLPWWELTYFASDGERLVFECSDTELHRVGRINADGNKTIVWDYISGGGVKKKDGTPVL